MAASIIFHEGFIPFRGWRTWYRLVGDRDEPGRFPLIVLHGGPGVPHDSLEPLEALASSGRRVLFYDQLGCGNSDTPADLSIYTIALFLEELDTIRLALGLEQVHLFGHSWGGMLALEYALRQPDGLQSLILSNTGASAQQWISESQRLVEELPQEVRETIRRHEQGGTTDTDEYRNACRVFYRRHGGGRIHPRPECLKRLKGKPGDAVYQAMWGPSEWYVTGTIRDWDVSNRLPEIQVPTLVIGAVHDHATPLLAETLQQGIPGAELEIFKHSGHFPHLEETGRYLELLGGFLDRVEAAG